MMAETKTRDFSRRAASLEFTADGESYVPRPALPPESLQEVLELVRDKKIREDFTILDQIFDIFMMPSEAEKIKKRFKKDSDNPLGLGQIMDITMWLIEEYSQRPIEPSSGSSSSSSAETDETGTSSTAGVPSEESTHSSSQLLASAI
jgi:hypothetical protein